MTKVTAWTAAIRLCPEGKIARRFARTYVIAFLAGAVGIACPPAKPSVGTNVIHPGLPNRNSH